MRTVKTGDVSLDVTPKSSPADVLACDRRWREGTGTQAGTHQAEGRPAHPPLCPQPETLPGGTLSGCFPPGRGPALPRDGRQRWLCVDTRDPRTPCPSVCSRHPARPAARGVRTGGLLPEKCQPRSCRPAYLSDWCNCRPDLPRQSCADTVGGLVRDISCRAFILLCLLHWIYLYNYHKQH